MVEQKNPFGFDPEADVIREGRTQWLDPIIIVSGGFDPVHKGHIKLFKAAANHGKVHVLLNSDEWLTRKKGSPFLPYDTREDVLSNMECIEKIHSVDDRDDTVVAGLSLYGSNILPPLYFLQTEETEKKGISLSSPFVKS